MWRHHRSYCISEVALPVVSSKYQFLPKWNKSDDCVANINLSNLFSPILWRLEISSRPYYNFDKMTIFGDLLNFSTWFLLFLIVSVHILKRVKNHELIKYIFDKLRLAGGKSKMAWIKDTIPQIYCFNYYPDVNGWNIKNRISQEQSMTSMK